MKPIILAFVLLVCSASLASLRAADGAGPSTKPTILFLFTDDQRADTIAVLGNPHIRTPHLDRLASAGVFFNRVYCMGAMQGATCVPSRAMLLSRRTLCRVKTNLAGQTTWPEAFARAGYATFITGKWHNGEASLRRIFPNGKAVFLGGMGWPHELPLKDIENGQFVNPHLSGGHSVKVFADEACKFIQTQARQEPDRPWLCYVAFNAPHDPRVAPSEFRKRYDDAAQRSVSTCPADALQ